ncbi:hypothetical protein ABPG75_003986 [Micractinium tetrahymenae]
MLGLEQMDGHTPAVAEEQPPLVRPPPPLAKHEQAGAAEQRDELARRALTLLAAVCAASLVVSAYWDLGVWQIEHMGSLTGSACIQHEGLVDCMWTRDGQVAWDEESRRQP